MTPITLRSADGVALAARVYEPPSGPAEGSVVIGGAMGVRQDDSRMAEWLRGLGVPATAA